MKNFKGKRVLVYGMGRSGQAASKLLHELGACVSIYDDEKNERGLFCFDEQPLLNSYDLVVVSPGVTVRGNQILSAFAAKKVPVMSELDLPRRKKLVARTEGLQCILTCTHAERVLYGKETNKIRIHGGKIVS